MAPVARVTGNAREEFDEEEVEMAPVARVTGNAREDNGAINVSNGGANGKEIFDADGVTKNIQMGPHIQNCNTEEEVIVDCLQKSTTPLEYSGSPNSQAQSLESSAQWEAAQTNQAHEASKQENLEQSGVADVSARGPKQTGVRERVSTGVRERVSTSVHQQRESAPDGAVVPTLGVTLLAVADPGTEACRSASMVEPILKLKRVATLLNGDGKETEAEQENEVEILGGDAVLKNAANSGHPSAYHPPLVEPDIGQVNDRIWSSSVAGKVWEGAKELGITGNGNDGC